MITLAKNVDVGKITYASPKSLDSGARMIGLYYDTKPFIIQTPVLDAPYGVSKWENDRGPDKLDLQLSFGTESHKEGQTFFKVMTAYDDKLIGDGLANAQNWFKKKLATRDVVEALYSPMVKHSKDKETGEITNKYPPTIKFQIPTNKDGSVSCEVYDKDCKLVDFKSMDLKRAKVSLIAQCNGIWIAGGKYGSTFKILQMQVFPSTKMFTKFAFIKDDDDTVSE